MIRKAVLLLAAAPSIAFGLTAGELLANCGPTAKDQDAYFCYGHIWGYAAGLEDGRTLEATSWLAKVIAAVPAPQRHAVAGAATPIGPNSCLPADVKPMQVVAVVLAHVHANPGKRAEPAQWAIREAVTAAFPCKQP